MVSDKYKILVNAIKQRDLTEYDNLYNLMQVCLNIHADEKDSLAYCLNISNFVKKSSQRLIIEKQDVKFGDLYWQTVLFEAPYIFESYLLYMEKNRSPKKRFYLPRQNTLKVVVDDLQDLEDGVIEFYGLSLPPRVGKSTICIFFLSWVMGRHPDLHNAMGGHSGILAKGFFKEALNLVTSPEYTYSEIFPEVVLESKSSDEFTINLNNPDRFATLTCRGIDGTWTGAVDISNGGYLYVDDLIRDRTESLSPIRLENRYQDYLNVMVDRKNDGAKELMVGTRWNLLDPLGKNEERFKNDPKARFRKIPALDENGESNFQYDHGVGFSTEYYKDVKSRLDKNEWEAKYMQRPFVREGLLFPEDELRTYNGVLPDGDHYCASAGDVAWGGGDSFSMPFGESFGKDADVYIPDWIFNTGDKEVTKPLVVGKIMQNNPSMVRFEANNGGNEYADDISRLLREKGHKVNISSRKADNQMSKMAKIIQYAPDIKRRFVFLAEEYRSEEYQKAIDELITFVQIGKNEHDDAADGLVQLLQIIDGGMFAQCEVRKSPI